MDRPEEGVAEVVLKFLAVVVVEALIVEEVLQEEVGQDQPQMALDMPLQIRARLIPHLRQLLQTGMKYQRPTVQQGIGIRLVILLARTPRL